MGDNWTDKFFKNTHIIVFLQIKQTLLKIKQ